MIHTPTPIEIWYVRPDYGKENVYRIWDEHDNYHDDTTPEAMDRRAALVQAAPAMLEALKLTLMNAKAPEATDWSAVVDRLERAIIQAEGGQS